MSVRRCGVQRSPRARSWSRTVDQPIGAAVDPSSTMARSIDRQPYPARLIATTCNSDPSVLPCEASPNRPESPLLELASLIHTPLATAAAGGTLGLLVT